MNVATLGFLYSILTGVIVLGGNIVFTSWRAGRTEGVIKTTLAAHAQQLAKLEQTDRDQWKVLGEHTDAIGVLKGRVNGKAHGHSI